MNGPPNVAAGLGRTAAWRRGSAALWSKSYGFVRQRVAPRLRSEWPAWLLLALPLPFIARVFAAGHFVYYIDSYVPFNPSANLGQYSGAWSDYNGIGTLNVTNLSLLPYILVVGALHDGLGLSIATTQGIVFYAVLAGAGLSMYAFARSVGPLDPTRGRVVALAAAVAYVSSPVFLDLYWYLNFPGSAGVFLAAPGLGYLIVRGLRTAHGGRISLPVVAAIGLVSVVGATSGLPYIVSAAILGVFFVVVGWSAGGGIAGRPDRRPHFLVVGGIATLLMNLYWLLPLASVTGYVAGPNAYDPAQSLRDLAHNSALASPFRVPTLLYFPGSNQFANWAALYRAPDPTIAVLGALLLAVGFSALLARPGDASVRRRVGSAVPVAAAFLLMTFLFLFGSNPRSPTASGFVWLFEQSPILQAFLRGPYLTIGNATAFLMAFLIGEGVAVSAALVAHRIPSALTRGRPRPPPRDLRFARALTRSEGVELATATFLIGASLLLAWPLYTGSAVTDLANPASPVLPSSATALGSFLHAHQGDATTVALPASNGLVRQNWSSGYLGAPVLPFLVGSPVLESFNPPLGAGGNDVVPFALTLPSFGAGLGYDHLLQVLGAKYVVVDSAQADQPPAAPFNLSAINLTLTHQRDVAYVGSYGSYALYGVNHTVPRVFAPQVLANDSGLFQVAADVSHTFAIGANNTTDMSAKGLWSSTAPITNVTGRSFRIDAYWPSPLVRSTRGTGLHFPGWPEVTNLPPLDRPIGDTPLAFVNVSGSTNFQPVIWFSTLSTLGEWTNNITAYDRSLSQFFIPPLLTYSFNNATDTRSYVYNLASLSGGVVLHTLDLNHIMVELQPVGDYWGYMNATVTLGLGGPAFTRPTFDPNGTVFAPAPVAQTYSDTTGVSPRTSLTYARVDASDYRVRASGARGPFAVVLLQDFDEHWGIPPVGGISRTVHFLADGYANGWIVYPTTSDASFRITFGLQPTVVSAEAVSVVAFGGLIAVPVVIRYRGRLAGALRRVRLRRLGPPPIAPRSEVGSEMG